MSEKIEKPDAIWRNELTSEQYKVCRQCWTALLHQFRRTNARPRINFLA